MGTQQAPAPDFGKLQAFINRFGPLLVCDAAGHVSRLAAYNDEGRRLLAETSEIYAFGRWHVPTAFAALLESGWESVPVVQPPSYVRGWPFNVPKNRQT